MNNQRYIGPGLVVAALIAVLAIAGVNIVALAPLALILIVCPLMMFFMMRGMGHGRGHGEDSGDADRSGHGVHNH